MKPIFNIEIEKQRRKKELFIILSAVGLLISLYLIEYFFFPARSTLSFIGNLIIFGIINFNILLVILIGFLIIRNISKILFEDRQEILGRKLRTKLSIAFIFMSFIPTVLLFWVSYQFIETSMTRWFDIRISNALNNALLIGQTFYQEKINKLQDINRDLALQITIKCIRSDQTFDNECVEKIIENNLSKSLNVTLVNNDANINSLEIFTKNNTFFKKTWLPITQLPGIDITTFNKKQEIWIYTDQIEMGTLIRVIRPITKDNEIIAFLAVGSLMPQETGHMLDIIKVGYESYNQFLSFQKPLMLSILTALGLIAILIIFIAVWFALRISKTITEPVKMLSEATQRIAQGDLNFTLSTHGRDELHSLVNAFNIMTQDLKEARRRAEIASMQLQKNYIETEERKNYIETVLQNITAGVISLDRYGIITTMNKAAELILGKNAQDMIGKHYQTILTPEQKEEFEYIRNELLSSENGHIIKTIKIIVNDKLISLLINFNILRDKNNRSQGVVIVFDNLTEIERIERQAAWREVARMIAHEIKNPLTPIKLSAQRLQKRCKDKLDDETNNILMLCTNTIINQVESLKKLVTDFSTFAKMPAPKLTYSNLLNLIDEILLMYREAHPEIEFKYIRNNIPMTLLDSEQIKRAIINLLDNAITAVAEVKNSIIEIGTNVKNDKIILWIADNGIGITNEDKKHIFEPYFSKKKGGTGLGLSIVNSIIIEHQGKIEVEDNKPNGIKFIIELPILTEETIMTNNS
jgi:two-component system nitrogen regulation sensor histidine kinase NtrY